MMKISPITTGTENKIIELVNDYIDQASHIFERSFEQIEVRFDLTGRAAGMYKVTPAAKLIRFNPYHFAKFIDENMHETVPHEVAHYISDQVYGLRHIRPHGKEWQAIMWKFGVEPKRTFSYSLEGIPTRVHKRHTYSCDCMQYEITTRRHNNIQSGRAEYSCRQCGSKIKFINHVA